MNCDSYGLFRQSVQLSGSLKSFDSFSLIFLAATRDIGSKPFLYSETRVGFQMVFLSWISLIIRFRCDDSRSCEGSAIYVRDRCGSFDHFRL